MNAAEFHKNSTTGQSNPAPNAEQIKHLAMSAMIDNPVLSREGETLGRIHDFMVDLAEGKIESAIIEFGGFLGMNHKFFTVPFKALAVAKEHRQSFILSETRESIKQHSGFEQGHLPVANAQDAKAGHTVESGSLKKLK